MTLDDAAPRDLERLDTNFGVAAWTSVRLTTEVKGINFKMK